MSVDVPLLVQTSPPQRAEEDASERHWIQGLKERNESLSRDFYRRYAPQILSRLAGMLGDLQQAEDCTQQVFLEAMQGIQNFRGESSISTWLYRISTRVVYKHFQKRNKLSSFMELLTKDTQTSQPEQPIAEKLLVDKETRQLVWDILELMSPRKRIAILLCDLEGCSLNEASEMLGIPAGTVSSRLNHGRKEFRERLHKALKHQGLSKGDMLNER
tara:strand:- start:581 stop:1228 length:648 start_codon:yes stop_codon:yes gene_type:complete